MDIKDNLLTLVDGSGTPREGFGLYRMNDQATVNQAAKEVYEGGYRLFDTAQSYENEQEAGAAFRQLAIPHDNIFVTTKVAEENQGYDETIESVRESLRKLQMGYVDLLLVHWPIERSFFDTWRAFGEVKKEGLTRSIGVSNYQIIHLQYLATQANGIPVIDQIELHPLLTQKSLLEFDRQHRTVTQAWSPLGRGAILNEPVLKDAAAAHNRSTAQVMLRWHLQNGISFIPRSIHEERIAQNTNIYNFEPNAQKMAQIDVLNVYRRTGREPESVYEYNKQY